MAKITRFEVMAVLQAARARALGLDQDEAKSWGLNRALFYAAAKRGWQQAKALGARQAIILEFESSVANRDPPYVLGGEKAFRSRDYSRGLRFKFGRRIQEPADFDRQVREKFGARWDLAWAEAQSIIRNSARRDLDIQSRFFNRVYEPRRDQLAEKWSRLATSRRSSEVA